MSTVSAFEWLEAYNREIGGHFTVRTSDEFVFFTDLDDKELERAAKLSDYAITRVRELFPEIDFDPPLGHWPTLLFGDHENLIAYYGSLMGDDEASMIPGGVWVSGAVGHFVMPYSVVDTLDAALAHELIHGALDPLPTPIWLEEGIAMNVELAMGHQAHPFNDYYSYDEIRGYFTKHDPIEIIAASNFKDPLNGKFLYSLSQLMVACLLRDRQRFHQFIIEADKADYGASALKNIYDLDLNALAAMAIKPPQPNGWLSSLVYRIFGYS